MNAFLATFDYIGAAFAALGTLILLILAARAGQRATAGVSAAVGLFVMFVLVMSGWRL